MVEGSSPFAGAFLFYKQQHPSCNHSFWIKVLSAKSPYSTVMLWSRALGGYPPNSSKLLIPLIVDTWLKIYSTFVSRLASTGTRDPLASRTWIVVTGLLRFGSRMKFSWAPFFFVNFVWGFFGSPSEVPVPENAMYGGGGGGVYFSEVLSLRLTDRGPFGYFSLNFLGILPSLSSFMNALFSGTVQSWNSPSSMLNPFSQRVILHTLPSFSFSYLAKSSGVLDKMMCYFEFFSAFSIREATSGLMTAIPLLYPPVYDSVFFLFLPSSSPPFSEQGYHLHLFISPKVRKFI